MNSIFLRIGTNIGIDIHYQIWVHHVGPKRPRDRISPQKNEPRFGPVSEQKMQGFPKKEHTLVGNLSNSVRLGLARHNPKSVSSDGDGQSDQNAYRIMENEALLKG